MLRRCGLGAVLAMAFLAFALPARADDLGVLILAHGAMNMGMDHKTDRDPAQPHTWEDNVENLVGDLNLHQPTEVAFGMAESKSIQAAVDKLEARGVKHITVVPLFISSHSPIIDNSRYILGLRDKLAATSSLRKLDRVHSKASFAFTQAMDAHPIISDILLQRANALAPNAAKTDVVVIAHGPNDEAENRAWLRDMDSHAAYLRKNGKFQSVTVLTHRNDPDPKIKGAAKTAFRQAVATSNKAGRETVVVPLLLSEGGIETEVEGDLKGLKFKFAKPLMPHPDIEHWVESRIREAANKG